MSANENPANRSRAWLSACVLTGLLVSCSAPAARANPPAEHVSTQPADDSTMSVTDAGPVPMLGLDATEIRTLEDLTPERVQQLMSRYRTEPSAETVVRAALRASEVAPQRYASMLHRARLRGLVPNLLLGARRGQGVDLRSSLADEDAIGVSSGADLVLSATLRFELGRLLFADEEVSIAREARAGAAARLELARSVIHWYFVRRRLQLERDGLGHTTIARELRIVEIESLLDTFTSGAFGRMISARTSAWTTDENTPVFAAPSQPKSTSTVTSSPAPPETSHKAASQSSQTPR